jgi:hypothetical protein
LDQKKLDQQSQHWEKNFSNKPEMFGLGPSHSNTTSQVYLRNFFPNAEIVGLIFFDPNLF